MNKAPFDDHQEKLKKFKQAIENNTFSINSDRISSALLEAQQSIQQDLKNIEQIEQLETI